MNKLRLLVVEDEGIVADDLKMRLEDLGYDRIEIVHSGKEALEAVRETKPDLVLMDIRLQGEMDGIETAEKIHELIDVPVLYVTAYSDEKTLARAKVTEPFAYIIKPFSERELHSNIEMALYKFRTERRLRENERWLSAVLKGIGDGVIVADEKGNVLFMNRVAEGLTEWKEEEAVGKPLGQVFNVIHTLTREPYRRPVERSYESGTVTILPDECLLLSKGGEEANIDASIAPVTDDRGDVTGLVIVFRDVTEDKLSEDILREKESRYRTIVERSPDINSILDGEGVIRYVTQSVKNILKYEARELTGENIFDLVHPDDRERVAGLFKEVLAVPDKTITVSYRQKHREGGWCLVESTARAITENGEFKGIIMCSRDITDR